MTRYLKETISTPDGVNINNRSGGNSLRDFEGVLMLRENTFNRVIADAKWAKATTNYVVSPDFRNRSSVSKFTFSVDLPVQIVPTPSTDYPDVSEFNQLTMDLRNKIRTIPFNAAVAYRERSQTAKLVASTATNLLNAAKAVKRGRFHDAARHLGLPTGSKPPRNPRRRRNDRRGQTVRGSFSNAWLSYSYGWVPLYSDIYGSMVAADQAYRPYSIQKVQGMRRVTENFQKLGNYAVGNGQKVNYVRDTRITRTFKMAAHIRVSNPRMRSVDDCGVLNPALTLWEAVPYSFVIDWVWPVGRWLQQLPPLSGVTIEQCFKTKVVEEDVRLKLFGKFQMSTISDTPLGAPPGTKSTTCSITTSTTCTDGHRHLFFCERSTHTLSAVFRPPGLEMPTSWRQALSALSLFHNFMSKNARS